jgi:hypothetical protein
LKKRKFIFHTPNLLGLETGAQPGTELGALGQKTGGLDESTVLASLFEDGLRRHFAAGTRQQSRAGKELALKP